MSWLRFLRWWLEAFAVRGQVDRLQKCRDGAYFRGWETAYLDEFDRLIDRAKHETVVQSQEWRH